MPGMLNAFRGPWTQTAAYIYNSLRLAFDLSAGRYCVQVTHLSLLTRSCEL